MSLMYNVYVTLRGAAVTIPWLVQLLAADVALSLLLPVAALFPTLTYDISSTLASSVWYVLQLIFTRYNRARISTSGSSLPPGESAIVIANHVSWTDFYLIQELAIRSRMLGRCRWFAKEQLKWVPFLGWGLWAMGMPLVSRNWVRDSQQLERVFGSIVRYKRPIWLISYSEGTRFTPQKYQQTIGWCKENGKTIPRNTLYPRTKGFVATVNELRRSSHVKAVYDCTIGYAKNHHFQRSPSFWQSISTPRISDEWKCHIHVDRYPIEDLPKEEDKIGAWLEERWIEKGDRLEHWKENLAQTGDLAGLDISH